MSMNTPTVHQVLIKSNCVGAMLSAFVLEKSDPNEIRRLLTYMKEMNQLRLTQDIAQLQRDVVAMEELFNSAFSAVNLYEMNLLLKQVETLQPTSPVVFQQISPPMLQQNQQQQHQQESQQQQLQQQQILQQVLVQQQQQQQNSLVSPLPLLVPIEPKVVNLETDSDSGSLRSIDESEEEEEQSQGSPSLVISSSSNSKDSESDLNQSETIPKAPVVKRRKNSKAKNVSWADEEKILTKGSKKRKRATSKTTKKKASKAKSEKSEEEEALAKIMQHRLVKAALKKL